MLELRGIDKGYREGDTSRQVFAALDARFDAGRISAIIGRSGCGKSTLLNLIAGIDLPDAGAVLFAGEDVTGLGERERTLHRRRHIGFVFQFFNLIPTLTVAENLELPLELIGSAPAARGDRIDAALGGVGLAERRGAYPDRLSGGEQQRVAVARALIHQPALVLADEPTGNLDSATGREVLALLVGAVRERGATLVMVTHSREAAASADRVFAIEDRRLRTASAALPG